MLWAPSPFRLCVGEETDLSALLAVHLRANRRFVGTGLVSESDINRSLPASFVADCLRQSWVQVARLATSAGEGEGDLVGFAMCRPIADTFYLDQISVDPAHGRKGLGGALLRRVIRQAAALGHASVALSTFRDLSWNGPFYRRYGFREIAHHRLTPWMRDIEATQALSMDVSQRCFMQRSTGGLLRLRTARATEAA
jgi:predicted N-acetyltransferase YhbS